MDKPAGCPGLSVHFTNTSTGFSSSATYKWDFGNGNTSTVKDPGANYKDPKQYTVKLTVTDGGKTDTKTNIVTVYQLPTVDFSAGVTSGCQPLPVTFTSTSTPGDGTIATYFWDYGDGNSEGAGAQPQHTYSIPQAVTVSLTVTNSYGCYSIKSKEAVNVFPSATASFNAAQTVLCKITDAVTFTNTSSSAATSVSYAWDFGDGTTSTEKSPQHVFGKKGTFTIKLGVKTSDGCKDESTQTDYINVANFTTDFSVPPLICENTNTTFTSTSNPQSPTSQNWLINGYDYYGYNQFSYTFFKAGAYKVQLVNTYGTCTDTATKNITVQPAPVTNGFIADLQGACGAPVTVKFKDTTSGAVKWAWDFNYNNYNSIPVSYLQAPSYTYTSDGSYWVNVQATNAAGCSAAATRYLSIYHPNANISSSRGMYGCTNLTTVFSAYSQATLKDYKWNFNDGTSSTEAAPQHNFTKEGSFNVTLAYTDSNGCKGTANFPISILGKPNFDFTSTSGTTICGNTPVNFNVTGSNTNGYYSWSFGDYDGSYYYNTIPSHQYYYDSVYTVSLVISNYGCSDTVTKKDYIKVLPPFPKIALQQHTCDGTRGLMAFTESSVKATGWSWDFGDGSGAYAYNSFQDTIRHTFAKTGSYKIALTAKNGNCAVRDSITAYVFLKQKPLLSAPQTEVCGSEDLKTTISNLETNPAEVYYYDHDVNINKVEYGDSTQFHGSTSTPDFTWRNSFRLYLTNLDNTKPTLRVITNSYYFNCPDTTNYIPIKVKGPTAGYTYGKNDCFKLPVSFTDTSTGSNGVPIVKWEWDFGDGQTAVTSGGNKTHNYAQPGTYYTSLKITDKDGCTNVAYQYGVSIGGTKAAFTISQNPVLPNIPIYFYNNSSGNNYYSNLYTWQFGDGTTENSARYYETPTRSYAETGVDTVRLIVKDEQSGCTDTATQYINVKNTNLSFAVVTSFINPNSGCPPAQAKFTNTSNNVKSITWDFGDGATAGNLNYPSHIYEKPGKYKVSIYGYFYDNSVDSSFDYVTIAGPYATLKADKLFACGSSELVTLSAEASNTTSFTWDFGDGTLVDATDTFATHMYLTPNVYTPSLIVKDGKNCSFPFFLEEPVVIDTLHVSISRTPQVSCDSALLLFTPEMTSVAKDNLGKELTYLWDFGTGNSKDTANTELSSFVYNDTGSYTISLHVASPYGCAAHTSMPISVKQTPKATITGVQSICEGLATTFAGSADVSSSALSWHWYIANNNLTSVAQNTPEQYFTTPGSNPIQLIVGNGGCYDTVYHPLWVDAKPVVAVAPKDSFVCLGNKIQLEAHDGIAYNWLEATNISNKAIANPYVSPVITTSYQVEVTSSKGCISRDSIVVRVRQPFTVTAPPLFYLCKGSSLPLSVSGADTYQWTGTGLDNPNTATPVTATQTPQTYMIVGFDNDHCFTDTATTEVKIAELPSVKTIDDITIFAGSPLSLATTGSNDVTAWSWTPADYLTCTNCSSPVSHPKSDVLYIVKATTDYGCAKQDSVHINIICKQSLVQIPAAFTPGSDGKNDRFVIKGQGIKAIRHFVIFNRAGVPVFEKSNANANDASAGWDGTYHANPADVGSYIYMADILCDTGEIFHYKGTVVLIR